MSVAFLDYIELMEDLTWKATITITQYMYVAPLPLVVHHRAPPHPRQFQVLSRDGGKQTQHHQTLVWLHFKSTSVDISEV